MNLIKTNKKGKKMNEIKVTKPLNLKDKISTEYGIIKGKDWMEIEIVRLNRIVFVVERNDKFVVWYNTEKEAEHFIKVEESFQLDKYNYKITPKKLIHTMVESKRDGSAHIIASLFPIEN